MSWWLSVCKLHLQSESRWRASSGLRRVCTIIQRFKTNTCMSGFTPRLGEDSGAINSRYRSRWLTQFIAYKDSRRHMRGYYGVLQVSSLRVTVRDSTWFISVRSCREIPRMHKSISHTKLSRLGNFRQRVNEVKPKQNGSGQRGPSAGLIRSGRVVRS